MMCQMDVDELIPVLDCSAGNCELTLAVISFHANMITVHDVLAQARLRRILL